MPVLSKWKCATPCPSRGIRTSCAGMRGITGTSRMPDRSNCRPYRSRTVVASTKAAPDRVAPPCAADQRGNAAIGTEFVDATRCRPGRRGTFAPAPEVSADPPRRPLNGSSLRMFRPPARQRPSSREAARWTDGDQLRLWTVRDLRPGDRVRIILGDWAGRRGLVVAPPSSGPIWGKLFVKIQDLAKRRAISAAHLRLIVPPLSRRGRLF